MSKAETNAHALEIPPTVGTRVRDAALRGALLCGFRGCDRPLFHRGAHRPRLMSRRPAPRVKR